MQHKTLERILHLRSSVYQEHDKSILLCTAALIKKYHAKERATFDMRFDSIYTDAIGKISKAGLRAAFCQYTYRFHDDIDHNGAVIVCKVRIRDFTLLYSMRSSYSFKICTCLLMLIKGYPFRHLFFAKTHRYLILILASVGGCCSRQASSCPPCGGLANSTIGGVDRALKCRGGQKKIDRRTGSSDNR